MSKSDISRRALVAGIAAAIPTTAIAVPAPVLSHAAARETDPIFGAIDRHKKLFREAIRFCEVVEWAELEAEERSGERRPCTLIQWRNWQISGSEIEAVRGRFLNADIDHPDQIEIEYRYAKERERAKQRAEADWCERHGIAPLDERKDRLWRLKDIACVRVASTVPTTFAGCAALVSHVVDEVELDADVDWQLKCLRAVAATLEKAVQS